MTQYINKAAVVAEIERRMQELRPTNTHKMQVGGMDRDILMWLNALTWVKDFLDTLEIKDIDEIIKNAEDHAYFAGSENTREKLINEACKWWEVELTYPSMTPDEIKRYKNRVRKFRKDMEDE